MAKKRNKTLNKGSAGQNRKSGEAFLEKYASKPDTIQTGSGLMYRIIDEGDEEAIKPTEFDTIRAHQRISHVDGRLIADTYKEGLPDKFSLAEAIPGLREGLLLMRLNARFEFIIPPELAWGKRGTPNKIGPNAVLMIDCRLLNIEA